MFLHTTGVELGATPKLGTEKMLLAKDEAGNQGIVLGPKTWLKIVHRFTPSVQRVRTFLGSEFGAEQRFDF